MTTDQTYDKDKDGNLLASMIYNEKEVEVKVGDKNEIIGKQAAFTTTNIISKEKVPILKKYLDDQLAIMKKNIETAETAMKQFGFIEVADEFNRSIGLLKNLLSVNGVKLDKIRIQKRLDNINALAGKIDSKITATANYEIIKRSLEKTEIQVKYLKENFK